MNDVNSPVGNLSLRPLAPTIGADVEGVDIRTLDDTTFAAIHRAWLTHHVLRFRGQTLDEDELLRFSQRFGELQTAPINARGTPWLERYPHLAVMSNIEENGAAIGSLGYGEAVWHTDMSYNEVTPSAAILYALEVSTTGGETGFLNMHYALETLPDELAAAIDGRRIKHDSSRDSAGTLRKGFDAVSDPRHAPGALHPAVIRHPETGARALYLGRRPFAHVEGLDLADSDALLDQLWAHATTQEHAWFQSWAVGDLLVWDNRSVMHMRRSFPATDRRYMLRTQIKGGTPSA